MENQGWIKLHRKLLENPITMDPKLGWFWVVLLLKASHDERDLLWNRQKVHLNPGQFITGREVLAKQMCVSPSTIQRWLKMLESEHQIEQQTFNKYRLITILKWNEYQLSEQQNEQQKDNKKTTKRQQKDTINNYNNENNEKNFVSEETSTTEKPEESPNKEINELLGLFKQHLNPHINFANKTERLALQDLLRTYGAEPLKSAILFLAQSYRTDPFMPRITSPYELKLKWAKIVLHINSKKIEKTNNLRKGVSFDL